MKQEDKIESILEAASRRFAHFGVDKTTMNEIADDLGISKASLYYYFPDKLNLYAAVLKKVIEQKGTDMPFLAEKDFLKGIHKYLEKRTHFILKNYRILEYLRNMAGMIPEELRELFDEARDRDVKVLAAFLQKGADEKKLNVTDVRRTTLLLNDSLSGLRMAELTQKKLLFPDESRFQELLEREKELVAIFLKGLGLRKKT